MIHSSLRLSRNAAAAILTAVLLPARAIAAAPCSGADEICATTDDCCGDTVCVPDQPSEACEGARPGDEGCVLLSHCEVVQSSADVADTSGPPGGGPAPPDDDYYNDYDYFPAPDSSEEYDAIFSATADYDTTDEFSDDRGSEPSGAVGPPVDYEPLGDPGPSGPRGGRGTPVKRCQKNAQKNKRDQLVCFLPKLKGPRRYRRCPKKGRRLCTRVWGPLGRGGHGFFGVCKGKDRGRADYKC